MGIVPSPSRAGWGRQGGEGESASVYRKVILSRALPHPERDVGRRSAQRRSER